jgi:hypothetical protein
MTMQKIRIKTPNSINARFVVNPSPREGRPFVLFSEIKSVPRRGDRIVLRKESIKEKISPEGTREFWVTEVSWLIPPVEDEGAFGSLVDVSITLGPRQRTPWVIP